MPPIAGTNKRPCRNELRMRFPLNDGTIKTVILREILVPEDLYLKHVRAKLQSIKTGQPISSDVASRSLKDILIKTNFQF